MMTKRNAILQRWQKWLHQRSQLRRSQLIWALGIALLVMWSIIPLRIAIALHQAPLPQTILVLGGGPDREFFAAQFAQRYPQLDIWVSSGTAHDYAQGIFRQVGIADDRVHLDRRATDTVTNFTTLVPDFKQRHIQHVYLITSDFHMLRAQAIATLVFGSQGIAVTPMPLASSPGRSESWARTLRDCGRSMLWLFTGRTGARFGDR